MNSLNEVRFIGFDADQTLWDFVGGMRRAIDAVVVEVEKLSATNTIPMTAERMFAIRDEVIEREGELLDLARVRWIAFEQTLREVNLPTDGLTKRLYDIYFANRSDPSDLFDDTNPVLERLDAAGYRLGLLTNGNGDPVEYGVSDVFEEIFRAEDIGCAKPDQSYFDAVQEAVGLEANQILLVGDSLEHDVRGAQLADWHAIWLNRTGEVNPGWVKLPPISFLGDLIEVLG